MTGGAEQAAPLAAYKQVMDMFDDVAAFLVVAPLAIVLGVAAVAAYLAFRHRPAAVHVKPKNRLSD